MRWAKLLLIVTNAEARQRLLATWRDFIIEQPGLELDSTPPEAKQSDDPVAFSRLIVRDGLGLLVFVVEGGWRREYVCQALAKQVDGHCVVVGADPQELMLAHDLLRLLADAGPGLVASAAPGAEEMIRTVLELPAGAPLPLVDCDNRESVSGLVSEALERLAAMAAA